MSIKKKKRKNLNVVAHACLPNYAGSVTRRIEVGSGGAQT
jgi:hypothetical protein